MQKTARKTCVWIAAVSASLLTLGPGTGQENSLVVSDIALVSGFQNNWDNHYRHGRALVAEDFDGDGRVDFYVGNPGDESFIFRNLGPGEDGIVRFTVAQILLHGDLAFVASGADYDNDGDLDLFIGCGGLDGACLDFLFRNDSTPGKILFTDVSREAGIRGPTPWGVPLVHSNAGAVWGDYDQDGDPDLFLSNRFVDWSDPDPDVPQYQNVLWRNNGDGTFTDVTLETGLRYWRYKPLRGEPVIMDFGYFQYSSWIDADNDGDLDLYLNNAKGPNALFRNWLTELGWPGFYRRYAADLSLPGEDLRFPFLSFASGVADFNNDGWQDLIVFAVSHEPPISPYGNGNGLFLNQQGRGFYNASRQAGINVGPGLPEVAMGCQVADVNADGIPDLVIGAGNPTVGNRNRLLLSKGMDGEIPLYEDASRLIDFEPVHGIDPTKPPFPEIPTYPYRTHGIAVADVDGDGHLEVAVASGSMAVGEGTAREPFRLFKFSGPGMGRTFRARLDGNGITDGRDGIGARAYVEIPSPTGKRRVYQTVLGGNAFSAMNERTLTFGLGNDTSVSRLAILWPASHCLQVLETPPVGGSAPLVLKESSCWTCPEKVTRHPVDAWLDPEGFGCTPPPPCRTEGVVTDGSVPVPWSQVLDSYGDPEKGVEARSRPDGTFLLEHPFEPGLCRISVLEPFGYLPVVNPVMEGETMSGKTSITVSLIRSPEGKWPRGVGYWQHQAAVLALGRGRAQEGAAEMGRWMEAIRARYPGLGGFESAGDLWQTFRGNPPRLPAERLRRQLATAFLNLASGRLSSYTILASGERVGDLVEAAYVWLTTGGTDSAEAGLLTARLETLNEGGSFP